MKITTFILLILAVFSVLGAETRPGASQGKPGSSTSKNSTKEMLAPVSGYDTALKVSCAALRTGKSTKEQRMCLLRYQKVEQYKRNETIDQTKIFVFFYESIASESAMLIEPCLNQKNALRSKVEAADSKGDSKRAVLLLEVIQIYSDLAKACQGIQQAYKVKSFNKMNQAIRDYITAEGDLINKRIKPPRRNWLTIPECRALEYGIKNNKNKSK